MTPLMVAAQRSRFACFRRLLEAGADVAINDSSGQSVVHRLSANKSLPLLQLLFESRSVVEINQPDQVELIVSDQWEIVHLFDRVTQIGSAFHSGWEYAAFVCAGSFL
eukprot:m.291762 g.291762  ORF g.291762 m.291762 type:complete len:108 (+) comp55101_c0_seq35:964-1287(+)